MSRYVLLVALWMTTVSPVRAEVRLDDAIIEAGVTYSYAPTRLERERTPMIGTGIRIADRNGLFSGALVALLKPETGQDTSCSKVTSDGYCVTEGTMLIGSVAVGSLFRVTTYRKKESLGPATEESGEHTPTRNHPMHSDVVVYTPRDGISNVTGFSIGMMSALYNSKNLAIELGLRWTRLRADVCGTDADPQRCRFHSLATPVRLVVPASRFTTFEIGWEPNLLRVFGDSDVQGGEHASPANAGLTLHPTERLYMRGGVQVSPRAIAEPGYTLELGLVL